MPENVISFFEAKKRAVERLAASRDSSDSIKNKEEGAAPVEHRAHPQQLSFFFGESHRLVVANVRTFATSLSFAEFAEAVKITHLIDMRAAPVLDFIKPTRQEAFRYLRSCEIQYFDMMGRAGVDTYSEDNESLQFLWFTTNRILEGIPVSESQIIFVFDNDVLRRLFSSAFSQIYEIELIDDELVRSSIESSKKLRM